MPIPRSNQPRQQVTRDINVQGEQSPFGGGGVAMSDQPSEDLGRFAVLFVLAAALSVLVGVVLAAFLLSGPHADRALFSPVEPPTSSVRARPSVDSEYRYHILDPGTPGRAGDRGRDPPQ
jgi:hypothetical protein